jgi:hypothetical protein
MTVSHALFSCLLLADPIGAAAPRVLKRHQFLAPMPTHREQGDPGSSLSI